MADVDDAQETLRAEGTTLTTEHTQLAEHLKVSEEDNSKQLIDYNKLCEEGGELNAAVAKGNDDMEKLDNEQAGGNDDKKISE